MYQTHIFANGLRLIHNYVPNKAVDADVTVAISNSFGFGGHNATLLFKKYAE